jgi:DNA-binding transcriptional regulator YhcF (GntR family)
MDKKNRETLKNYFKKGSLPSEKEFANLIDSMLNTIDDGFEKTEDEGLKISAPGQFR